LTRLLYLLTSTNPEITRVLYVVAVDVAFHCIELKKTCGHYTSQSIYCIDISYLLFIVLFRFAYWSYLSFSGFSYSHGTTIHDDLWEYTFHVYPQVAVVFTVTLQRSVDSDDNKLKSHCPCAFHRTNPSYDILVVFLKNALQLPLQSFMTVFSCPRISHVRSPETVDEWNLGLGFCITCMDVRIRYLMQAVLD